MNRIGRLVTWRLASRIGLVVGIFFGIILLVEFLDTWRFTRTADAASPWAATGLSVISALRWSLLGLPVTVLMGAIVGLIELHRNREMTVVSAAGRSIWSIVAWPLVVVVIAGALVSVVVDGLAIRAYQELDAAQIGWGRAYNVQNREVWFDQSGPEGDFVLHAETVLRDGVELHEVTVFRPASEAGNGSRIYAEGAYLQRGAWRLEDGVVLRVDAQPDPFDEMTLPTDATPTQLSLKLGTAEDLSWLALARALERGIRDPYARAAAETRFHKLTALPALLAGSLLIAFAFTSGYRRAGHYGWTVLYGIVLGLVVFVITEMADRAGSAGVLNPVIAAWGPAFAALLIGLSVMLFREDGRVS